MGELWDLEDQLSEESRLHGQEMQRLFHQVWAHHPESGMEEGLSDEMERELDEVRAPEEARWAKAKAELLAKIEAARAAKAEQVAAALNAARAALPGCTVRTYGWIGPDAAIVRVSQFDDEERPAGMPSHARITPAGDVTREPFSVLVWETKYMEKFGDWPND